MMRTSRLLAALGILAHLALPAAASAGAQADLGEAVSLSLKDAPAGDVLKSFAKILGAEPDLDPAVSGTVTVELATVSLSQAMDTVCRNLGCRWDLLPAHPPVLRILSLAAVPQKPLAMELEAAPVSQVLAALAQIAGAELVLAGEVGGTVTVRLEEVPWVDAADAVCRLAGCRWRLVPGDPPRLVVTAASTSEPGRNLGVLLLEGRQAGAVRGRSPVTLAVRFYPPGRSEPLAYTPRFAWNRAVFTAGSQAGWQVLLSWLPLAPGPDLVVPILVRCAPGAGGASEIHLLEPVAVPLAGVWRGGGGGARLELAPAAGEEVRPEAAAPDAGECTGWLPLRLEVRGREPQVRRLLSRPGRFVQVAVAGGAEPSPEAAVLPLGRGPAGDLLVAVLSRGPGDGGVVMRRGAVSPGAPWLVALGEAGLELTVAVDEELGVGDQR